MALTCDICKIRPAVTRLGLIVNGEPRPVDLCEEDLARLQRGEIKLDDLQVGVGVAMPTNLPAAEPYAKRLMARSADFAAQFGQKLVKGEHILASIATDVEAAPLLEQLGIKPSDLQGYIAANAIREEGRPDHVDLSEEGRGVFEKSFERASKDGAEQPSAGHVLLALAKEDGKAQEVLQQFGVSAKQVEKLLKEQQQKAPGKDATPLLTKYGRDLTELASQDGLDPLIGRELELQSVVEVLARRRKSNPVLVGEPGVGKTAIAEGLAQAIISPEAPAHLRGLRLVELSLGSVLSGAKYRGEFEERMEGIVNELKKSKGRIVVFIDELHTLLGAGAGEGSLDAANLLKPALARGEIRLMGATTLNEYQKYIEKDGALERRFQMVLVEPPSVTATIGILRGLREKLQEHHGVTIADEAIDAAAVLSDRYLTQRFLPDKAIDLLDQTAARKRMSGSEEVTREDVAKLLGEQTGVPVSQLSTTDRARLSSLAERLKKRVIGQDAAVDQVAKAVSLTYAGLSERNRPIASFFFMGPTGVGKTQLAKALAAELFGDESAMTRIDMSEYQERHVTARLIGSPPGYVGYDEAGQLTESIRRRPYQLILLDEFEKAHPDTANLLLQLLDDGRLTDGKGRTVDFSNTIIIATSNVGVASVSAPAIGFQAEPQQVEERDARKELLHHFRPEFVNRLDAVIAFDPLNEKAIESIVELELAKVSARAATQGVKLVFTKELVKHAAAKGFSEQFGARELKRLLTREVEQPLAALIISEQAKDGDTVSIDLTAGVPTLTPKRPSRKSSQTRPALQE